MLKALTVEDGWEIKQLLRDGLEDNGHQVI